MARIVVVGAGVAGLAAALGFAGMDHEVIVVERDVAPPTHSGDAAFEAWDRRSVPQFKQAHGFSSRARALLTRYWPGVLDRLAADGINEANAFKMLTPPEMHRPEDEAFTGFMARRAAFELAMRLEADGVSGIEFVCPAVVSGLVVRDGSMPPVVQGVRLEDGREVVGDLVIDAGGRRSPIPRWLASHGVKIEETVQDCGVTYFTRYFRRRSEALMPLAAVFGARTSLDRLLVLGFTGDHETYAITCVAASWDEELHDLRHEWAWDAAVRALPPVAPWVELQQGSSITGVLTMTGHRNVRREFFRDEEPVVLGLLPVGDALCTTNPENGWGASMALTFAFAACDAVGTNVDDLTELARRYHTAIAAEADSVYAESASADRLRTYRWRGLPVPETDREEEERQLLLEEGIRQGAMRDAVLGRALLRRVNLVGTPSDIFDDPEVVAHAEAMRTKTRSRAPLGPTVTREDVVNAIASARPLP
jgi:2-polyprenyl-6-methoxyphenol hydroxylase-like FAD-dependent oxidoreductase